MLSGTVTFLTTLVLGIAIGWATMFLGAAAIDRREERAAAEFRLEERQDRWGAPQFDQPARTSPGSPRPADTPPRRISPLGSWLLGMLFLAPDIRRTRNPRR